MLFSPFTLRGLTLKNRVGFSPMCTFAAAHGRVGDFHLAHYAARAAGGAGLVMVEATAVEARGVIAPDDLGIWSDAHLPGLVELARRIKSAGTAAGIQLAHAGRKAGSFPVDAGHAADSATNVALAIDVVGPSSLPFDAGRPMPRELDTLGLATVTAAFVAAARRAVAAGFDVIELHMAHGYLLSSFLSPLPNRRNDAYGGSFTNRVRWPLEVIDAVRGGIPAAMPLFVRVSAIDPEPGGQTIADTVAFARLAAAHGVDLIDCSAGGQTPRGWLKARPGYQVKFAEAVRRGASVPTAAVGVITDARQADAILKEGRADLVFVGRAMRDDPNWANRAAATLATTASAGDADGRGPARPAASSGNGKSV